MDLVEQSGKKSRSNGNGNGNGNGHRNGRREGGDARLRQVVAALRAARNGDFTVRLPQSFGGGVHDEIAAAFNEMVATTDAVASEIVRVEKVVGREGRMRERASLPAGLNGGWGRSIDAINALIGDLVQPTTEVARVIGAVANGDLGQKMALEIDGQPMQGEFLRIGTTVNNMVDQLNSFSAEVTRVAKEVGTEGKLGGQADVKGVSGVWKDLTDNVNQMASNLTTQVRGIVKVVNAVANGDLSQKLFLDAKGEIAALVDTLNSMTKSLTVFAEQVTTVARTVGVEGRLGAQAFVPGVAGTWKDLTDNVNLLANNLTAQVRNIAEVTTAVANGDLSKKISVDARGEVNELKNTINTMVDQLRSFAAEVTRVAKEVGTEGKLGGQAQVAGVSGTWKDLTDNVNGLAENLTSQVRNIAKVTTAVANGDLSQKITVDVRGEVAELKNTINTMVDQLRSFADEVTRVAKEVGTEGKLGGQARVQGVSGTWKDLTDNVNVLAGNLTDQVRNIAKVTTAVANGDLSQKITVEARGEILELKNTINTMVDQLNSFAAEVTRVAKEVGTEGRLGGQAQVEGVSGTWKDLTDNVNSMASNLTDQVRNIALVTTAVANGDLSRKITVDVKGEILELKNTINTMVDQLNSFASEVTRVAREVGTEGKLGGQAEVAGVAGIWKNLTDNVNFMARNLTTQVRGIVKVVTAVAEGDLDQKLVGLEARGEIAALVETINSMTETLSTFAEEVTRVAREVGSEGKLGGQAQVPGVSGTWKDLTDNVNQMAKNLTSQVRGIVRVVTAVANGDLSQKLVGLEAKGEIAALAETINGMTGTLEIFADQVSTVAREVGIDGALGGQAKVPGAQGTWRQLTDNVNQLAENLTTQVRAIADVAGAVTKGDLTRRIDVAAKGEVASLKDTINQMIGNLRETTHKNQEQDWLKTNLAKFSSMMQGQKSLETVSRMIMSELTPLVSANHGAFFLMETEGATHGSLKLIASYAYKERKTVANRFRVGEGLVGQCALERKSILLTKVPPDYVQINSGLGESAPLNIVVIPVLFEGEVKAVIELASFHTFSPIHQLFLDQLTESIGVVLNMIAANTRTEQLLGQSQTLAQELQAQSRELTVQQDELKRSNVALEKQALELEEKARLLEEQKSKIEVKNREVEQARSSLEEKAEQLSLISRYKSEFLANMSHELRTPLNSLLILAKLLADNQDKNLSEKQIEYARTIYTSGGDLLSLINEILDLSKVEAGKMRVEPRDVELTELATFVDRSFRAMADQKGLEFEVEIDPAAPPAIRTDPQRLQQVLKNLLANAFKFTEKGAVKMKVWNVKSGTVQFRNDSLVERSRVIGFSVTDTGIGVPKEKQQIIFEAFQQADGTTSRKYGGTGLGLSISREIARLLGGEIQLTSDPGRGSTFTFYLPERYSGVEAAFDESTRGRDADDFDSPSVVVKGEVVPGFDQIVGRPVEDDREAIRQGDRVLLIIEDDPKFAKILLQLARDRGFKGVVASRGDTGYALANELVPDAITLDIQLPVMDGWTVLDRLKRNPRTRHIPVHVISVVDRRQRGITLGAFAYLEKPVDLDALDAALTHITTYLDRKVKMLLLVEDDDGERMSIGELLGSPNEVDVTAVRTADEAFDALEKHRFDCMVVDLMLPGVDGFVLIENVKQQPRFQELPIIVYTGKDLSHEEEMRLKTYAESVILKTGLKSADELLDDTALFLHRVVDKLPERAKERIVGTEAEKDATLQGARVLLVDDDVRNIFAMTSMLEHHGMVVSYAESGQAGIEMLEKGPMPDIVLMDVMMPGMDGYQTMREIRKRPGIASVPIISVTAKALREDREKCLAAGASDYLPKPIEEAKLLDLLRAWLQRSPRRKKG